ncbi:MAG: hypothetical protein HPY46_06525 [Candidatus Aminicenantes bacterium]|nr:hypothetical protein [Candidatus Aminicenantes bacterium]
MLADVSTILISQLSGVDTERGRQSLGFSPLIEEKRMDPGKGWQPQELFNYSWLFFLFFFFLPLKEGTKKVLDKNINNFLQDISHILLQEV